MSEQNNRHVVEQGGRDSSQLAIVNNHNVAGQEHVRVPSQLFEPDPKPKRSPPDDGDWILWGILGDGQPARFQNRLGNPAVK